MERRALRKNRPQAGKCAVWSVLSAKVPREWSEQVGGTPIPSWGKPWLFKAAYWVHEFILLPAVWTLVGFTSCCNGSCVPPVAPPKKTLTKLMSQKTWVRGKGCSCPHRYSTSLLNIEPCLDAATISFHHGKWYFASSLLDLHGYFAEFYRVTETTQLFKEFPSKPWFRVYYFAFSHPIYSCFKHVELWLELSYLTYLEDPKTSFKCFGTVLREILSWGGF